MYNTIFFSARQYPENQDNLKILSQICKSYFCKVDQKLLKYFKTMNNMLGKVKKILLFL